MNPKGHGGIPAPSLVPLTPMSSHGLSRNGSRGAENSNSTSDKILTKSAWGGAAIKNTSQKQSSIVSADGSIMPKPGEVRSAKGNNPSPGLVLNTGNCDRALPSSDCGGRPNEFSSNNGGWDSRERLNKSGRFKIDSKSSIAAAAAAAAKAVAGKPAVPQSIKPWNSSRGSVIVNQPSSSVTSFTPKLSSSGIGDSKVISSNESSTVKAGSSSNIAAAPATSFTFRGMPSSSSLASHGQAQKNSLKSKDPLQEEATAISTRSSSSKNGQSTMRSYHASQGSHISRKDSVPANSAYEINGAKDKTWRQFKASNSGSDSAQWRTAIANNDDGKGLKSLSPSVSSKKSQHHFPSPPPSTSNDGAVLLTPNHLTDNHIDTSFGREVLEQELTSTRELLANSQRDCAILHAKNAELVRHAEIKEIELETLLQVTKRMGLDSSSNKNDFDYNEIVKADTQESPFLQSLGILDRTSSIENGVGSAHSSKLSQLSGSSSSSSSFAVPSTHMTVECLVDDVTETGLSKDSGDSSIWAEPRHPMDDASLLEFDYQDIDSRPQLRFEDSISVENSDSPFIPKLRVKPHAIEPLNHHELTAMPWLSPFRVELATLNFQPWQLQRPKMIHPNTSLNNCPLHFVSEPYEMADMLKKLCSVRELAIDTEYHSYRSYRGFLCLMQISTRDEDFIIDTLSLRSLLWELNIVLTDPKIVKVLHGADMDVLWLQKDLGLYLVNVFDTGQAARKMGYSSFSYSYLLQRFFGIIADKSLQMADWRVRPLPREMCDYARQDTHYLLDTYDRMRCELLDRDRSLLATVLQSSAVICAQTFVKDSFVVSEGKAKALMLTVGRKLKMRLDSVVQHQCFIALMAWRDRVARVRDESVQYVLEDKLLFLISRDCPTSSRDLQRTLSEFGAAAPPHLLYNLRGYLFWEIANVLSKGIDSGDPHHQVQVSRNENPGQCLLDPFQT